MRISPINNYQNQPQTFKAKKINAGKINELAVENHLSAKFNAMVEFFKDPANAKKFKEESQRYDDEVSDFINENIAVKPEVLNRQFGPKGGLWPHER